MDSVIQLRIKALCKLKNILVSDLCKDLHISMSSYRSWKTSSPSIRVMIDVANYFDVSLDYIAGRIDTLENLKDRSLNTD